MKQNNKKIFNSEVLNNKFILSKPNIMWYKNRPFFKLKDIEFLLLFCESNNIQILGAEGFYFYDNKIIPNSNEILDLSNIKNKKDGINFSRQYFKMVDDDNIYFEFVFNE